MTAHPWSAEDYADAALALLPRGRVWPRDPDSVVARVMAAVTRTFWRIGVRAANVIVDGLPRTAVELLPEWEHSLGLPDPCAGPDPTILTRQRSAVARLAARGGQSVSYFTTIAATLGVAITITQFAPAQAGLLRAGKPCHGSDWRHAWAINLPAVAVAPFVAGTGRAGEPLASWGFAVVECVLSRISPTHTVLIFTYVGSAVPSAPGVLLFGNNSFA